MGRVSPALRSRSKGIFPVALIAPPQAFPLQVQRFMDTRKGAGARAMSDFGTDYIANKLVVTTTADNGSNGSPTPGSLRQALAVTGPTWITFAPGLTGDITSTTRSALPMTSNTFLDGTGFAGTLKCGLNPGGGINNYAVMNLSLHEPWVYGSLNSNKQLMSFSNGRNGYMKWCTVWDGGDVLIASGAYYPQQQPSPYSYTVEECLLGPTPGEYALMAPIRGNYVDQGAWQPNTAYPKLSKVTYAGRTWYSAGPMAASATFEIKQGWVLPGLINGIDNDARNGKILNSAVDHNYLDDFKLQHLLPDGKTGDAVYDAEYAKYSRACYSTVINNILQGGTVRQPKSKGQTMDVVGNLLAKYGHPYRAYAGTTASNIGGAVSCEDEGLMNIEGNIWVPKVVGEQVFAMPWSRADELGVPRMTVDAEGAQSAAIAQDGAKIGDAFIGANNWLPGGITKAQALSSGVIEAINAYNGYDRTENKVVNGEAVFGYSLSIPDRSVYANAVSHMNYLETHCGNPYATTKPRYWREAHTGGAGNFPNA